MSAALEGDLLAHLGRFVRRLRDEGLPLSLRDSLDAAEALTLVDVGDCDEVFLALRTALKVPRRHWRRYAALFEAWWTAAAAAVATGAAVPPAQADGEPPDTAPLRLTDPAGGCGAVDLERGDRPGYTPTALLRRKAFELCSETDLRAVHRSLQRLAARLATRRSRRRVPAAAGPFTDLRRSLRRNLGAGGDLVRLSRLERSRERARLLLLLDSSGSMDAYTPFLLALAMALRRLSGDTEVFAFNTELVRVTPWIRDRDVSRVVRRLADGVPDWSGGTRIGDCLRQLVDRHGRALLDLRTVVIVFSDGLDRGDPATIGETMARLRARVRHVLWLNPLLGDPRYRPEARGMKAALPHVDLLAAAHDLESLHRVVHHVARLALRGRPAAAPHGRSPRLGPALAEGPHAGQTTGASRWP